jgi:hypothetical protein
MSFFDSWQWQAPPGLGDLISFGKDWANQDFRSPYEQSAQKFLNHLYGGDLAKQQKAMNTPFITNYTNAYDEAADSGMRDADRNYAMSTAMLPAGQQALRAAQQGVMDTKAADQKGIGHMNAYSQAINAATGAADTGLNRNMQGNEFGADLWSNALNKYQMVKKPGLLSQIGQIAGVAGQLGVDALTAGTMGAPWGKLPGTG